MNDERRRKRKEVRLVQQEATWLQKALFALGKAETAHEKLAEFRGEEVGDYSFELGDGDVSLEDIEDALQSRLSVLMDKVMERRQALR